MAMRSGGGEVALPVIVLTTHSSLVDPRPQALLSRTTPVLVVM
jgi:hypothetical protein